METATAAIFQRVVLIEDEPAHAHIIRRALRELCVEIVSAPSLAEGIALLTDPPPDLIITDLHLPDAGGGDIVASIRKERATTPLLVLTASTSLQDAVEAVRSGADDFLVKDFGEEFRDILGLALRRTWHSAQILEERRRVERERRALELAIEQSSDGMAVATRDGRVAYANLSFRQFALLAEGDALQLTKLFGPAVEHGEVLQKNLNQKLRELSPGAVWHLEAAVRGESKCAFGVSLSVTGSTGSLESAQVAPDCVVWIRDITEQKRREKFQRELLSTTTHDIKGPLGAILISADLLKEMVIENEPAHGLSIRIASAAQSAVNIIDEFLSARRIQEGSLLLKPRETDVAALTKEIVDTLRPSALARGQTISVACAATSLVWSVDRQGFGRVLSNLLTNAIKFSPKGGKIDVLLNLDGAVLHLLVQDNGCGVDSADLQKLFERFSRLEEHRDLPGTGLGLFVVRSIVSAHGGAIQVTSQKGQGTTFDLSWPASPPVNERGELLVLSFG